METPVDEAFEACAALKLTLRGLALAFVAGLVWHLPSVWIVDLALKIVAGFGVLFAIMPLAIAGKVVRNVMARTLGLQGREGMVMALGFAILGLLLALAALLFRFAGTLYT